MLLNLFDKTATQQGFINHVDDIRCDHEPEREDQRNIHTIAAPAATKSLAPRLFSVPLASII
jgi:hypothetical protein